MENHPIPQDVTGFKFRLIGSITLKQFLYLLGAGVFALIFYILPIPLFVKIPFMIISGLIGMAFAFVPIDGRPMDKMIFNFAKAIPAENQFIYHKKGADMIFFAFTPPIHAKPTQNQLLNQEASKKAQMFNQFSKAYFKPDQEEKENLENISQLFQEGPVSTQGFTSRVYNADAAPISLQTRTNQAAPEEIKTISEEAVAPHMPTTHTEGAKPAPLPQAPQITQQVETPTPPKINIVASSTPPNAEKTNANGAYTPNVIQGIVKDPRGKPLPHVVIEVLDAQNIPVRAFRTVQNGTFKSVTPLPNGTYTIHLEDSLKKQNFTDVPITLEGEILEPIEITSVDQREQLRRELFGGGTTA